MKAVCHWLLILAIVASMCVSRVHAGEQKNEIPDFHGGTWIEDEYLESTVFETLVRIGTKKVIVPWVISRLYWEGKDGLMGRGMGTELSVPWDQRIPIVKQWATRDERSIGPFPTSGYIAVRKGSAWVSFHVPPADMRFTIDLDNRGKIIGLLLRVYNKERHKVLIQSYVRNVSVSKNLKRYRRINGTFDRFSINIKKRGRNDGHRESSL